MYPLRHLRHTDDADNHIGVCGTSLADHQQALRVDEIPEDVQERDGHTQHSDVDLHASCADCSFRTGLFIPRAGGRVQLYRERVELLRRLVLLLYLTVDNRPRVISIFNKFYFISNFVKQFFLFTYNLVITFRETNMNSLIESSTKYSLHVSLL